jgi:hypothetical protein
MSAHHQRPLRIAPMRLATALPACVTASPSDLAAETAALPARFAERSASTPLSCAAFRCLVAAAFFAAASRSAFVRSAIVAPSVVTELRRSCHAAS